MDIEISTILEIISDNGDSLQNGISAVLLVFGPGCLTLPITNIYFLVKVYNFYYNLKATNIKIYHGNKYIIEKILK